MTQAEERRLDELHHRLVMAGKDEDEVAEALAAEWRSMVGEAALREQVAEAITRSLGR